MTAKTVVASSMSASVAKATNQTGCGEMNSFTFSLTVAHELAGDPPMDEQSVIDYIILRLEAQNVLHVLNIVRDY
jgi:hypothetical protein